MNFAQTYDATISELETKLGKLIDDGSEFDFENRGGVLTIEFNDGEKVVITPQSPLEQLWVSADYGGHRFKLQGGDWVKEKIGQPLMDFLSRVLSTHLGQFIEL